MKNLNRLVSSDRAADRGMTLIEVVVAISLIGIIATAAISLTITSIASVTTQQRSQVAIALASNAMETVTAHTLSFNPDSGESRIYDGRAEAAVVAAWTSLAGFPGTDSTYPVWDSSVLPVSAPDIPIDTANPTNDPTPPPTLNGTEYRVRTLIGACYQPNTGGDCARLTGEATPPVTEPAGYSKLIRIVVVVSWTAGGECAVTACTYQTSTLLDVHQDLKWKVNG
ncbi:hypothetical protein ADILRU_1197 [Leifsonia rubra CMS 76R]|nr:hypothetical protein ADILRU_1197 [Leifsonia rubra CMS 76R]